MLRKNQSDKVMDKVLSKTVILMNLYEFVNICQNNSALAAFGQLLIYSIHIYIWRCEGYLGRMAAPTLEEGII